MKRKELEGVFAPVVTPFGENGEISYDGLKKNIERLNKSRLGGYLVLGTNGEFKSLGEAERRKVLETVVSTAARDKAIMAGTGMESTSQSIIATKEAAELGAHFASLIAPSFFVKKMTDQALLQHFSLIADASPIPVLLYNNPGVAVLTFSAALIGEISKHPNVVGMKDTSTGNFAAYVLAASPDFSMMAGSAAFFLEALFMGGTGGVLSIANFAPDFCCRVYDLWREGKLDEARAEQFKLMALNQGVSGKYGVAGVKEAMNLTGFSGGLPRLPLPPVSDADRQTLRDSLIKAQVIGK